MIKAIIFDLDGTLLDRDSSLQHFIANQYERFLLDLGHIDKKDYIDRFVRLDCRGHVWKDKVYQSLVEEFKLSKISWKTLLHDYETQFIHSCIPFPHLKETITLLQKQNYVLGIITNGRGTFQSTQTETNLL